MNTSRASRPPAIPEADLAAISAAVTARRTAAGLSGYALARDAGISPAALQKIERGNPPSLGTLIQLARALGCTVGDLAPVPVAPRGRK